MIKEFVDRFMDNRQELEKIFASKIPESYNDLVSLVVSVIKTDDNDSIDPNRIHEINDGDYQGTLLFVIASADYHHSDYWFVKVAYGSCSGCDTLLNIQEGTEGLVTVEQINDCMNLALHIVQGLKKMEGELDD